MKKCIAAIDMGTNSFHLIIVEVRRNGSFKIIDREREVIRLGSHSKDGFSIISEGEIEKAIAKVKTEDIDAALLERTKSNLKYGFAMGIDTPGAIARSLSHYIQLTGDPESINRLHALYDQVSVEDIKMIANKYFIPEHLTIATISDDELGALK